MTDKEPMFTYNINAEFENTSRLQAEVTAVNEKHAYELFLQIEQVKELSEKYQIVQYSIIEIAEHEAIADDGRFQVVTSPCSMEGIIIDFVKMLVCKFEIGNFINTHSIYPLDDQLFDSSDPLAKVRAISNFGEYLSLYHPDLLDDCDMNDEEVE